MTEDLDVHVHGEPEWVESPDPMLAGVDRIVWAFTSIETRVNNRLVDVQSIPRKHTRGKARGVNL